MLEGIPDPFRYRFPRKSLRWYWRILWRICGLRPQFLALWSFQRLWCDLINSEPFLFAICARIWNRRLWGIEMAYLLYLWERILRELWDKLGYRAIETRVSAMRKLPFTAELCTHMLV
jgi:hypothetical protein